MLNYFYMICPNTIRNCCPLKYKSVSRTQADTYNCRNNSPKDGLGQLYIYAYTIALMTYFVVEDWNEVHLEDEGFSSLMLASPWQVSSTEECVSFHHHLSLEGMFLVHRILTDLDCPFHLGLNQHCHKNVNLVMHLKDFYNKK